MTTRHGHRMFASALALLAPLGCSRASSDTPLLDTKDAASSAARADTSSRAESPPGVDAATTTPPSGEADTDEAADTTEELDATGAMDATGGRNRRTTCARSDPFDAAAMAADVAYLASKELDGRVPGSPGDVAARKFVSDRFACLGLEAADGMSDYEQPFTNAEEQDTANVVAVIPGSDVALAAEVVVLSAHTDHLGAGKLGANDDASGVAGLLAIADALANGTPPKRTIVVAAFGSEEPGFEGSEYFATHAPEGLELSQVVFSVNMDMIGSYTASGNVWALGAFDGTAGAQFVKDAAANYPSLDVGTNEGSDQSDNVTYCSRGIPYLFFWTEDEACYHKSCDTVDRIDVPNMATVARLTHDVTLAVANSPSDLHARRKANKNVCLAP